MPATTNAPATTAMDNVCPIAMGRSDHNTTARLFLCSPSATANSQPVAGLMPWKAPSPPTTSQGQTRFMGDTKVDPAAGSNDPDQTSRGWSRSVATGVSDQIHSRSRVAVRVRRAVATLKPDLVRPMGFWPLDKEPLVEG